MNDDYISREAARECGKSMKADRTPDALRRAAALLEEYQALGTPDRLREIRRREIDLTVENFTLRRRLEEQQEVINRLNRCLDAVQANARERNQKPS